MIKSIIAPVDFSEAAGNALLFAAEISKRVSARLIIIHVMPTGDSEAQAIQKLELLVSELQASFGASLNCTSLVAHGDFVDTLTEQISAQRVDLIVMGTKGASGLKRILIGSNTVKVLAHTKVPVMVIPEVARFEDFNRKGKNRVVFATDLEEVENEASLDILAEVVGLMIAPTLRVLNVRPKNTRLGFSQEMERAALVSRFREDIETERITVFDDSVMDGINFYLDKHTDTGMVAMIARDSGGLFQRHFTHEMAAFTHYPLLVLNSSKD